MKGFNLPPEKNFKLTPAGTTLGLCYRVIDMGTQSNKTKEGTERYRIITIYWELPEHRMAETDKPQMIMRRYRFSASENSNLRKDLESWRGKKFTPVELKEFDLANLIGRPALLNIVHSEDEKYANVNSVLPPIKGMVIPKVENDSFFLCLEPELFSQGNYDKLSDKMKESIASSPEYKAMKSGVTHDTKAAASSDFDDEIPF